MKKDLLNLSVKAFIVGISFAVGALATTAIAVTVSATFTSGDTLTAASMNVIKSAIESIPDWAKSGSDAVYTAGNVGIGTTSPDTALSLTFAGTDKVLNLSGSNNTRLVIQGNKPRLDMVDTSGAVDKKWIQAYVHDGVLDFSGITDVGGNTVATILAMDTTTGNVGIGTTTPGASLEVNGTSKFNGVINTNNQYISGDGENEGIKINSFGTPVIESSSSTVLSVVSTQAINNNSEISFSNTNIGQNWNIGVGAGDGNPDTSFGFWDGTGTRLSISNTGNVGIGTAAPTSLLHVNGAAEATAWNISSSREYKESIKKVNGTRYKEMLDQLIEIDLNTYKYKKEFGGDGSTRLGFVSEEMPEELLSKSGKSVDLYALLAYTIGAVKAQQKKIDRLEAKLKEGQ